MADRRCLLLLALVPALLLGGASTLHAQAYRWQDEEGRIHFTDDPGAVPARFRTQVEQLELPEPAGGAPQSTSATAGAADGTNAQVAEALGQLWPDVPAAKRQALVEVVLDRLLLVLIGLGLHTLATLAMFGHALASGRRLWAAGNLLLPFIPPLYVLLELDAGALKKGLIVVAWATGPAAAIALHFSIARIA
jgi:hypothetical protein